MTKGSKLVLKAGTKQYMLIVLLELIAEENV